jgi:membrane-bound ClpP family serine protease
MAPATNIGSSTPVSIAPQTPSPLPQQPAEEDAPATPDSSPDDLGDVVGLQVVPAG